jgi:hypothetical protein
MRILYRRHQPGGFEMTEQEEKWCKDFLQWYVENAFDLPSNPIGSRQCGLQRKAYYAAKEQEAQEIERLRKELESVKEQLRNQKINELVTNELAGKAEDLDRENCRLREELAAARKDINDKQAKIDALMLEYCPNEMTNKQIIEWGKNQDVLLPGAFVKADL